MSIWDIEPFGEELLKSNDLDPIYVALYKGFQGRDKFLGRDQVSKWLLSYWCFYDAGSACFMAESDDFWHWMEVAAHNEEERPIGGRWPRGHERRHFRGRNGTRALAQIRQKWPDPVELVRWLGNGAPSYEEVAKRAQTLPMFGPWISFKIGDMLDRVLPFQIDFSQAAVFMFKDPVQAALRLWRQRSGLPENARPKDQTAAVTQVVEYLVDHFKNFQAPPKYDRPVGLQEAETILCKWKSHGNGHYPIHNDILDIRKGLIPWAPVCPTAERFLEAMPDVG